MASAIHDVSCLRIFLAIFSVYLYCHVFIQCPSVCTVVFASTFFISSSLARRASSSSQKARHVRSRLQHTKCLYKTLCLSLVFLHSPPRVFCFLYISDCVYVWDKAGNKQRALCCAALSWSTTQPARNTLPNAMSSFTINSQICNLSNL